MERRRTRLVSTTAALLIVVGSATSVFAQALAGDSEAPASSVQLDPEIESLLTRADQLAARKDFDLAATLWQKLLDESGHHLLSTDGARYVPLRELIFQKLAALPPSARAVYRITADGEARGLLEATPDDPERREVALAETVRRFFLTSVGDDAAFELAGLALDRRDFVTASRLTRAITQRHPDPSVPLAQVLLRQAVADAYLGDRRGADAALERLAELPGRELGALNLVALREYLAKEIYPRRGAAAGSGKESDVRSTTVSLGAQPDLPTGVVGGMLTEHLVQEWPLPREYSGQNLISPNWGMGVIGSAVMFSSSMEMMPSRTVAAILYRAPALSSGAPIFEVEEGAFVTSGVDAGTAVFDLGLTPHAEFQRNGALVGELTDDERRAALAVRWRERLWHPTMQLLPVSGGLLLRSHDEVARWDVQGGRLVRRWQAPWKNSPLPPGPHSMSWSDAASNGPVNNLESILFGDGLALVASAQGDLLFVLEGSRKQESSRPPSGAAPQPAAPKDASDATPALDPAAKPEAAKPVAEASSIVEPEPASPSVVEPTQQTVPSRQRKNFLAVYEPKSGKLVWRRAADDAAVVQRDERSPETGGDEAGFVGPPVAWNDRLLVPVLSGGSYSLLAINVADGTTLWKTPLGDEPDAGVSLRSASCVAIAGGDVYVALGTGMVFALDARSGAIHWGTRYGRDVVASPLQQNPYGGPQQARTATFHGWESDAVIVSGNAIVVLASDHDQLLALDRRSGDVKWRSPRRLPSGTSARYCLGTLDRRLFVAGVDVIRAYDIPSGRLEWEQPIRPTSGHGALTTQAIYLPILGSVDAAVLTLDPRTGRELGQAAVTLSRPEPLGNLHSDGQRLWVAGANRLFALTHVPHQLQELARGVEQRRVDDVIQRARLLSRLKRHDEALADIRLAHELLAAKNSDTAAAAIIELLVHGKLAHERPLPTLQLITECKGLFNATAAVELVRARDQLARAALGALQRKPAPATAAELLRLIPDLLGDADPAVVDAARLVDSAARTIDRAASNDDLPALRQSLQGADVWRRIAALPSLVTRGGDADLQLVETLLAANNPTERLVAAESLARIKGRRSAFATLIELANTDNLVLRRRALLTLRRAAGDAAPATALGATTDERAASVVLWKAWYGTLSADLPAPISRAEGREVLDRILVTVAAEGLVIEYDAAGREVWRQDSIPAPTACAITREGHRLVLIQGGRQIVEYDSNGEQVWQSGVLPYAASSVERLPDGNTLLACPQRDVLLEIAPDGHLVRTIVVRGNPASAQRLDEYRTLVALMGTGRVVEVARNGETTWEAAEWPGVVGAQRLPSGRTFVVQPKTGFLALLDPSGQPGPWQRGGIKTLVSAVRDARGATVLADALHLEMLAPDGRSLWSHDVKGITGIAGN